MGEYGILKHEKPEFCGICGSPIGKVYFWHRELEMYLCPECAESFKTEDLTIYFDFRKRPIPKLIQGLNYLEA